MFRQTLITEEPFEFEAGGSLPNLTVAYHVSKEYREGDKVIVICHALTANSDAEEWWPQLVGPGKLFDTQKYFILCVNMLGSPYGSSGPVSINPATGAPYLFDFPKVTVRDMIRASILVRKHLGVSHIDLLVGSSIGGFQAFEWAVMEPDVVRNVAFMATAPRISAWISATMESQRMALEADPTFRECTSIDGGKEGLKAARAQALISYRGYDGYCATQSETDQDTIFAGKAASYEKYQGEKFAKRFDAYSYWYLTYAVDSNNVGRGRGGVEKALSTIKSNSIVVAIDSDNIFPPKEVESWAKFIPNAKYHEITSLFAHDGFLLEHEQISKILEPIINK